MRRSYGQDFVVAIARIELLPHRVRPILLRLGGVKIGTQALIMSGLRIAWGGGSVELGDRVYINFDCFFDAGAAIVIEDRVHLADHVRLITSTHKIGDSPRRAGKNEQFPIRICAGCWLGTGVTILPGLTVGPGCIVAAGAVVTKDCPRDGLYGGVPAKRIRDLPGPPPAP